MPTVTTTAAAPTAPSPQADLPLDTSVAEVDAGEPDWGAIADASSLDDDEVITSFVEGDQVVVDDGAAPVVAATPVVAEPAAAVVEEPAPVVAAVPVVAAPAAPVQPVAPAVSPEATEQEDLANLEALYGLSEAEAEALATEPEVVLPKMLAKQHLRMTKSILASVQGILPQMMQATTQSASVETAAREQFFSVNKDLAKPEYQDAILQIGKMYRQVNPKATAEVAVKTIGEMVRISLGLPAIATGATEVVVPSAPAVPVARPFTPARGGSGSPAPATPSVWEELASADE